VWDENELGLRALERAERRAVAEHAPVVALVVLAAAAEEAPAACCAVGPQHAVADPHLGHSVAGRDNGADVLVADHESRLDLHAAVVDVEIRAADPGCLDADDRVIVGLGSGIHSLLDPDVARRVEGDGSHP
jgi:hypothetical protein